MFQKIHQEIKSKAQSSFISTPSTVIFYLLFFLLFFCKVFCHVNKKVWCVETPQVHFLEVSLLFFWLYRAEYSQSTTILALVLFILCNSTTLYLHLSVSLVPSMWPAIASKLCVCVCGTSGNKALPVWINKASDRWKSFSKIWMK